MRTAIALVMLLIAGAAQAQFYRPPYWSYIPSGYCCWGAYREWPRGFYGWTPGYHYYGPGYYRPFSYWGRNPYYRY